MDSKLRRIRRMKAKKRTRESERLQEWQILKQFALAQVLTKKFKKTKNIVESLNTSSTSSLDAADVCVGRSSVPPEDRVDVSERRIIDVVYFLKSLREASNHDPQFDCTFANMNLQSETNRGLRSGFVFKCDMCGVIKTVWSEPQDAIQMDLNSAAVSGIMTSGGGFTNLQQLMGSMNVRCMSVKTFEKYRSILSLGWKQPALQATKAASEEETALTRKRGDVDQDGVPLVTAVVSDDTWTKRSYTNNYNSSYGVMQNQAAGYAHRVSAFLPAEYRGELWIYAAGYVLLYTVLMLFQTSTFAFICRMVYTVLVTLLVLRYFGIGPLVSQSPPSKAPRSS